MTLSQHNFLLNPSRLRAFSRTCMVFIELKLSLQDMQVGHGDAAQHRADNTKEALVGSGKI